MQLDNTIVALATPSGTGAIGLIRISGKEALKIASKSFKSHRDIDINKQTSHKTFLGWFKDGERIIDKVLLTVFRGPNSYTGENIVEISCHGSSYILQEILALLIKNGAEPAKPGEFTLRAFLNKKMDLTQAESVADLIASESKASHELAINQMRGGYSKNISDLRGQLIHFASMIALELDFSEEDVEFANRDEFSKLLEEIESQLKDLSDSFAYGSVIKNGVPVAIIGKPNAGKSSLLNALLNEDKAIVSEIEGTTRDSIEDTLIIKGIQFRFIDTAGLRDTKDKIESIGVKRTLENAKKAKILLYIYDVTDKNIKGVLEQLKSIVKLNKKIILIQNKMDIATGGEIISDLIKKEFNKLSTPLPASTNEKISIQELKSLLVETINEIGGDSQTIVTNVRHHNSLNKALKDIQSVKKSMNKNVTGDLISVDLNSAIYSLGEITGEIDSDEVLGNVFQNFCIGK
ncbi:MAG: tRNA uridine-5-carboxymethylaminomethyl(34) synthesis GTPase MnmE [Flavobacteriaceae bacterium]|nr:tRNA uridine-5-carboxymethylaminomethyl(34) synthesis GTPase MnmE [Flavobacteriaceae bacterium]